MKNRIYKIRTQKGLSLTDVCSLYKLYFGEKLSVKKLRDIEEGKLMPPLGTFLCFAELFDVTLDYLLCRTDEASEELRMHQKGLVETDK